MVSRIEVYRGWTLWRCEHHSPSGRYLAQRNAGFPPRLIQQNPLYEDNLENLKARVDQMEDVYGGVK